MRVIVHSRQAVEEEGWETIRHCQSNQPQHEFRCEFNQRQSTKASDTARCPTISRKGSGGKRDKWVRLPLTSPLMKLIRCPKCDRVLSPRFPIHNCKPYERKSKRSVEPRRVQTGRRRTSKGDQ